MKGSENDVETRSGVDASPPNKNDNAESDDGRVTSTNPEEDNWGAKVESAIDHDSVSELHRLLDTEGDLERVFHTTKPVWTIRVGFRFTALLLAAEQGKLNVFEYLVQQGVDVLSQTTEIGFTAFHLAAMSDDRVVIMRRLLEINSNLLKSTTPSGKTALILASDYGYQKAVEYLLDVGADITARDCNGQTALHGACTAWSSGHERVCEALLGALFANHSSVSQEVAREIVTMADASGETPMSEAARGHYTNPVLQLLSTPVYFPDFPAHDEVALSDDKEAKSVEALLLAWKSGTKDDERLRYQEAVAYWAILNGRQSLTDIAEGVAFNRGGASWAHVAAIGGHVQIAQQFLKDTSAIRSQASMGMTPLHIASVYGHVHLVTYLLGQLSETFWGEQTLTGTSLEDQSVVKTDDVGMIDIICMSTEKGQTPVDIAALGGTSKHKDVEILLWDQLRKSIGRENDFFLAQPEKAKEILELAARSGIPGKEDNLHQLFQMISARRMAPTSITLSPSALGLEGGRNALHWAIYYQCPTVVWWLLANGAHLGERHIIHGIDINDRIRDKLYITSVKNENSIIQELLSDPPPIVTRPAPDADSRLPSYRFEAEPHGHARGTIMDFHKKGFSHLKRRLIWDIIYGAGPQRIMTLIQYRLLSNLNGSILAANQTPFDFEREQRSRKFVENTGTRDGSRMMEQRQLRWFHFPTNAELMVRISRDQGLKNKDHRPLAQFVQESCVPLPAGGLKFYMKPQCVGRYQVKNDDGPSRLSYGKNIVCLYMPYLSWMEWSPETSEAAPDQQPGKRLGVAEQEPMTLDQYYYVSLDNTADRDRSQVIGRYIQREKARHDPPSSKNNKQLPDPALHEDETIHQILVVNQIWLWILDDRSMITCTATEPGSADKSFLEHALSELNSHPKDSVVTAKFMTWLIISTAVGFFNSKQIPILGAKKSPLDVFHASIRFVRNMEAGLFKRFQESLDAEENSTRANSTSILSDAGVGGSNQDNEYNNIAVETRLLQEVKDICDELNILKNLCEDQENVWNQASDVLGSRYSTLPLNTPFDVKKEIMGMIHEAEVVQQAIDTLLDLKQKQANITEAKFARQQAQDTAKQTDTIVVFTVVTIVFLPLSFLTSLFALNISNFPHEGNDVAYKGWWIFPILFGVSTVVSGFFMTIAFQANSLKMHLAGGWGHLRSETKKKFKRRIPQSPAEDERV
ncbi:hypothetical protein BJX99DRAFT_261880 [Aspergillus californicus]